MSQHITHNSEAKLLNLMKVVIDTPKHLQDLIVTDEPLFSYESPLLGDNSAKKDVSMGTHLFPESAFMADDAFVLQKNEYDNLSTLASSIKFSKAGPYAELHFDHNYVRAAIVTCGGLCPGLNVVVREIVMSLYYNYGVNKPGSIYGIRFGYKGFYTDVEKSWIKLTPQMVSEIHKAGGTFLGSSRGGFSEDDDEAGTKILD